MKTVLKIFVLVLAVQLFGYGFASAAAAEEPAAAAGPAVEFPTGSWSTISTWSEACFRNLPESPRSLFSDYFYKFKTSIKKSKCLVSENDFSKMADAFVAKVRPREVEKNKQ